MFYNIPNIGVGPLEQTRWVIFEVCDIGSETSAFFIANYLPLTVYNNRLPWLTVKKSLVNGKQ